MGGIDWFSCKSNTRRYRVYQGPALAPAFSSLVGLADSRLTGSLGMPLKGSEMDNELYEFEERARFEARDKVSDEMLMTRMLAYPNMGGSTLVTLSKFIANRVVRKIQAAP